MDDSPQKQCSKCKHFKPATLEFFTSDKPKKDGLHSRCKQCRDVDRKPRYVPPEGMRRCSACKNHFPATLEYFSRNARRPSGLQCKCKDCDKKQWEQYSQSHHEPLHVSRRTAKQLHPESYKAAQSRYCQTEHGKANRCVIAQRRRARVASAPGSFTAEDVRAQYARQKGKCFWRGEKLGDTYHVDHYIPLSRGGTNWPDNIVLACPHCNLSRNDRLPHEWPESGHLF